MKNQAAAVTEQLIQAVKLSLDGRLVLLVGAEIIPAHAADDVEVFMQRDLIRGINPESGCVGKVIPPLRSWGSGFDCYLDY